MYPNKLRDTKHERMIAAISTQQCITRYALFLQVNRQNVAEHTARAAQIMGMVIMDLQDIHVEDLGCSVISPEAAFRLMYGIVNHDLAESVTGDIPYLTKRQVPAFEAYEKAVNLELFGDNFLNNCLHEAGFSWSILIHLVDMVELVLHCTQELKMGNTSIAPLLMDGLGYAEDLHSKVCNILCLPGGVPTITTILDGAEDARV